MTPIWSREKRPSRKPRAQRGKSGNRWAMAVMVSALRGETPVFHATSADTDRAPVTRQMPSWTIYDTISTMRPSMAVR